MVQPAAGTDGSPSSGKGARKTAAGTRTVLDPGLKEESGCHSVGIGPRCADVAEKLAHLFGWRQTYKVEKLQRCLAESMIRQQQQRAQNPHLSRPVFGSRRSLAGSPGETAGGGSCRNSLLFNSGCSPTNGDEVVVNDNGDANGNTLKEQVQDEGGNVKKEGKGQDAWVAVHSVTSADGGLLDPDDRLADVADDREQLTAAFEETDHAEHVGGHTGGDGASGSSVGTGSPDIFHGTEQKYGNYCSRTDIEVTDEHIASGLSAPLQVRRGSEPALNQLGPTTGPPAPGAPGNAPGAPQQANGRKNHLNGPPPVSTRLDLCKRWSAAPIIMENTEPSTAKSTKTNGFLSADWEEEERESTAPKSERPPAYGRFARDGSSRLSMQFFGDSAGGFRWADAAERAALSSLPPNLSRDPVRGQSLSLPRDHRRKEPLGQANSTNSNCSAPSNTANEGEESTELVVIRSEAGPLGIHVVPDYDPLGKERGLLIQCIEPGGRIDRDHRLQIYDRIVEINGRNLLNMPFQTVQEIFKDSLHSPELQLRVVKHKSSLGHYAKKPPAPVFPRSSSDKENVAMVESEERLVGTQTKLATVSPTKKLPSSSNVASHPPTGTGAVIRNAATALLAANTRRIGRKVTIDLTKGAHGLGFSITTRDNPAGGNCPIYIKNILPKGAAVEDGRLKPGDRLLEVNGVEMTGKTQAEAVTVLRNAPAGSVVHIVVSRQDDGTSTAGSSPQSNYTESSPESSGDLSSSPLQSANNSNESQDSNKSSSSEKNVTALPNGPLTNGYHKTPEKRNDESMGFSSVHKEILQFDIPVHDTEKAGLGVSVKGKTSSNHSINNGPASSHDLGIFVKSVLHGGAASRDGRLRTNDQLLNVNGVSLLNQSNADATETLRRAMLHSEGPIPGVITLTIARRTSSPLPSNTPVRHRDSLTSSSGTESNSKNEDGCTPDNSGTSENSDSTVIFLPYKDQNCKMDRCLDRTFDCSIDKSIDCVSLRNPVIDRLTGHTQSARHNESYYRATHDMSTWNTTALLAGGASPSSLHGHLTSPTVNSNGGEMVLIEETPVYGIHQNRNRRDGNPSRRPSSSSQQSGPPVPPPQLQHQQSQQSEQSSCSEPQGDVAYASQLSLDESAAGFSRDAFGRQSMSEKRHATLDAKNTDTYQRNKKLREEREKQKHQDHESSEDSSTKKFELGPSLGMKKSSSLESLQTMVQEIQMQEDGDPAYTYRNAQGAVRVIRGRGCNESFRAAVDRSYEAPLGLGDLRDRMETLAEEDGVGVDVVGPTAFASARGAPRNSSLNAMDAKKLSKKKPGLLKGIGSMFRFGKHRKPSDIGCEEEVEDAVGDMEAARRAARDEQQRIQEQYRRLMQKQNQMEEQHHQQELVHVNGSEYGQNHQHGMHMHHEGWSGGSSSEGSPGEGGQSRTQRIHQLRAQHQRRHVERRGQYPLDEREERYEQAIQQRLDKPYQHHQPLKRHSRPSSTAYDLYGEMTRPGSRVGITDPNQHFSHYVNYEEIQQHLNRRQQHYHSQRRDNRESHQRPVSNFYEYESVQAVMRVNQQRVVECANSLPRRSPQDSSVSTYQTSPNLQCQGGHGRLCHPGYGPVNGNGNFHHATVASVGGMRQGPFVTHVTIREAPHTPGSKV